MKDLTKIKAGDTLIIENCPFCGWQPRVELGKKGSCQLHGEPFQPIVIRCAEKRCVANPKVEAGDIFNDGEEKARAEAIAKWNTRLNR